MPREDAVHSWSYYKSTKASGPKFGITSAARDFRVPRYKSTKKAITSAPRTFLQLFNFLYINSGLLTKYVREPMFNGAQPKNLAGTGLNFYYYTKV